MFTALASAIVVPAVLLASAVRRIPEGQAYSLHRFGRPVRILGPGVHVVVPFLDRVAHKISLRGRILQLDRIGATIPAERVTIYWQVLDPDRAEAMLDGVEPLLRETTRHLLASAEDESTSMAAFGHAVKEQLNQHLQASGMLVTRVELG